jgi:hypothetical protein
MSACPKASWPWVKTMLHSVYDQPDTASVHAQFDRLVAAVADKLPKGPGPGGAATNPLTNTLYHPLRRKYGLGGEWANKHRHDYPSRGLRADSRGYEPGDQHDVRHQFCRQHSFRDQGLIEAGLARATHRGYRGDRPHNLRAVYRVGAEPQDPEHTRTSQQQRIPNYHGLETVVGGISDVSRTVSLTLLSRSEDGCCVSMSWTSEIPVLINGPGLSAALTMSSSPCKRFSTSPACASGGCFTATLVKIYPVSRTWLLRDQVRPDRDQRLAPVTSVPINADAVPPAHAEHRALRLAGLLGPVGQLICACERPWVLARCKPEGVPNHDPPQSPGPTLRDDPPWWNAHRFGSPSPRSMGCRVR